MTTLIVVLSDFNIGVFERYARYDEDRPSLTVEASSFDKLFSSLAKGPLRPEDVAFVWTRPEGVLPSFRRALLNFEPVDVKQVAREVNEFGSLVADFAARHRSALVASWVMPPNHRGHGMLNWHPDSGLSHVLAAANAQLASVLGATTNAYLLDSEYWFRAGGARADSPKQWFAGKVPYSNVVFQAAVADVKAAIRGIQGLARRLVIVDLDDTLWGGVVGDVGWNGLRLGGHDRIGEAFQEFQRALKALGNRGILLAVVSKNTESVALEAIESHPEMLLERKDFAGWKINWDDKAVNVRRLLDSLNIGANFAVFIDNSPAERARIRGALPDVFVPEWPADPAYFAASLRSLRCFDTPALSEEDRARVQMYSTERERQATQSLVTSIDDWLAALDLEVSVAAVDQTNVTRVAQLLNKTNQMNLATTRRSEAEVLLLVQDPDRRFRAFSVADRFGPSGLTGVIGLHLQGSRAVLTDFVLSCRVMGRQVEEVMLHVANMCPRGLGATLLIAEYVSTMRNMPCLEFFRLSGMTESEPGVFCWDSANDYALPLFVDLIQNSAHTSDSKP